MAPVSKGIENNGSKLNFGDYTSMEKIKLDNFAVGGNIYKIKTCNEITRLEKNGKLLFESAPGSTVYDFEMTENLVEFSCEGHGNTFVTLELLPQTDYNIYVGETFDAKMTSNISGKVSVEAELSAAPQKFRIETV